MKKKLALFLALSLVIISLTGCGINETVLHESEFVSHISDEETEEILDENYEPAPWNSDDESEDTRPVESLSENALAKFYGLDYWGFSNIGASKYNIHDEEFATLEKNLFATDKKYVDSKKGTIQGGMCFGLSVTTALKNRKVLTPEDLYCKYDTLNKSGRDNNIASAVNFYHIQQGLSISVNKTSEFMNLDNEEQLRRLMKAGLTGTPFVIGYGFINTEYTTEGAHAVVGYGIESGDWSKQFGSVFGNKTYPYRICIYDCNDKDKEKSNADGSRDIYLNFDEGIWCIPAYHLCSTTNDCTNKKTDNAKLMRIITENDYLNIVDINTGETSKKYKENNGLIVPCVSTNMNQKISVKSSSGEAKLNGSLITKSNYKKNGIKTFCSMDSDAQSDTLFIVFPEYESFYSVDSEKELLDIDLRVGAYYFGVTSDSPGEVKVLEDGTVEVTTDKENAYTKIEYATDGKRFDMDGTPSIAVEQYVGNEIKIVPTPNGLKITADEKSYVVFDAENYGIEKKIKINDSTNNILVGIKSSKIIVSEDVDGDGAYEEKLAEEEMPTNSAKLTLNDKTASYIGKVITIAPATAIECSNKISYIYYVDKNCTKKTTQKNSGAAKKGKAPVNAGTYYVKAIAQKGDTYFVNSNTVKLTINKSTAKNTLKATSFTVKKAKVKKNVQYCLLASKTDKTSTFKKVSGNKNFAVSQNGKIKIKKGTKAGTYKIKVKISSKNYTKSRSYTITIKIK